MIRYIHGSSDSTDLDVVYVFEQMPSFQECQRFCCADPKENRNIVVVEDGIVKRCFKGNPDEVNNAILATWPLHEQEYPLVIEREVPRDIFLKDIAVTRKVMSPLTASPLRGAMKEALRGDWSQRLAGMRSLRFTEIDFDQVKKWKKDDLLKSMAFQIGQGIGLHCGVGLYTKADIAAFVPQLRLCLYREEGGVEGLQSACENYLRFLEQTETEMLPEGLVRLPSGAVYDIHRELRVL